MKIAKSDDPIQIG